MKLRNLMYASMIACAFASCSKDDVPAPGPEGGDDANATLDVKVLSLDTKTTMPSLDNKIETLKLVVFTPDNSGNYTVEVVGVAGGSGNSERAVKAPVKPGVKKVLVLANYAGTISAGTTLDAVVGGVNSLTQDFTAENSTNGFSMNSKIFNITVVPSKTNYLGYGKSEETTKEVFLNEAGDNTTDAVKLYRNVAKVRLDGITFKVKSIAQYPEAALDLKRVFILHAKNNTYVASVDAWGKTESGANLLIGATAAEYKSIWVAYMEALNADNSKRKAVYNYVASDVTVPTYTEEVAHTKDLTSVEVLANGGEYNIANTFYVYENTATKDGYQTLLVVEAAFSFKNTKGETKSYNRFYPVAVGENADFSKVKSNPDFTGRDYAGVLRNLAYGITMTISGPGYETPFGPKPDGEGPVDPEDPDKPSGGDTFLDTQVKVVNFGEVTQNPDIE